MPENEQMFEELELRRGNLRVTWEYIGEGLSGDYNHEDPQDVPLLRFTVSRRIPGMADDTGVEPDEWQQLDDASYCTRMPNVGVEPKKENEKEKERVVPSERLLVDLLHAKRVLYMCLLNMPDKYLLEDSDAQALMATLAKDKQIQTILASINEGLEQHPGEDKKGRV